MSRWRSAVGVALLILGGSVPSAAQAPREGVAQAVRTTHGLMIAAFPDLSEEPLTWRVQLTESGHIVDARPAVALGNDANALPVRLRATVTVSARGQVETAQFSGALIEAARSGSLPMQRHGESSPGRFAPDDPTTPTRLVSEGVRRQLGMTTVVTTRYREEAPLDAPAEAQTWRVELDDPLGGGLVLVFEPLEGRLLSVVRR